MSSIYLLVFVYFIDWFHLTTLCFLISAFWQSEWAWLIKLFRLLLPEDAPQQEENSVRDQQLKVAKHQRKRAKEKRMQDR